MHLAEKAMFNNQAVLDSPEAIIGCTAYLKLQGAPATHMTLLDLELLQMSWRAEEGVHVPVNTYLLRRRSLYQQED